LRLVLSLLPRTVGATVTPPSEQQRTGSAPHDHQEIEWQFDAVDLRPVERWLDAWGARAPAVPNASSDLICHGIDVVPMATRRLVDTYVDTADWRLNRAGFTLRVRGGSRPAEATLKSMAPATGGIRRRREVSEPLTKANLEALLESEGPVGGRIRLIAGKHPLAHLFEVRTVRRSFSLLLDGSSAGKIALDRTTIPVGDGGEPVRLKRVEVEVHDPDSPALASFVEELRHACGLRQAKVSKFEAGLIVLGGPTPPGTDLGPTIVESTMTVGQVAFAVLRSQLHVFLAKEGGTRLGEDPEELHDMRVAARRLRAALSLFVQALPARAAGLREELKWVGRALGDVRDLDVQIQAIREWRAGADGQDRDSLEDVEALLAGRREGVRRQLLEALDSPRYERLVGVLMGMFQRGPLQRSIPGRIPVLAAAPDLIQGPYKKLRKAGKKIDKRSDPAVYHRARIRAKRFRYALEFLSPVYGRPAARLAKRVEALQDVLGLHQDAQVAMGRLRELALDPSSPLSPGSVFAMGRIAERHARQADRARRRFPKLYARVKAKPWREFARSMEQRRPAAPTPVARRSAGARPVPPAAPASGAAEPNIPGRA